MAPAAACACVRHGRPGPAGAFETAIASLTGRVAREDHPGALSHRSCDTPAVGEARAVIDDAAPEARIGHQEIARL